jgi:hypothetical protein
MDNTLLCFTVGTSGKTWMAPRPVEGQCVFLLADKQSTLTRR